MNNYNIDDFQIIYRLDSAFLAYKDKDLVFVENSNVYYILTNSFEPCLYIKLDDIIYTTIHNSFTIDQISNLAKNGGNIKTISGNEYDIKGICELLLLSIKLGYTSYDISYLEGYVVIDKLIKNKAISKETAIDISNFGIKNTNMMHSFLHSKKVKKTDDNKFFVLKKE